MNAGSAAPSGSWGNSLPCSVPADYILGRDETPFETELHDIAPHDHNQIRKYLSLSDEGKLMVDIMLNAVHEREHRIEQNSQL